MRGIPEDVQTVQGEGRDLKTAIAQAAEQLGVPAARVAHKLDLSHFRSSTGGSVARSTVRIIGWATEAPAEVLEPDEVQPGPEEEPAAEPEPAEEPMPDSSTPASDFALEWFQGLMTHMSVEGEVQASAVRRLLAEHGLDRRTLARTGSRERRRWVADRPGRVWHADVCHGPARAHWEPQRTLRSVHELRSGGSSGLASTQRH